MEGPTWRSTVFSCIVGVAVVVFATQFAPTGLVAERAEVLKGIVGSYHTHNWNVDPLMAKPTITVETEFPTPDQIIGVGMQMLMDADTCQNAGCSFSSGTAMNMVQRVSWSDGGRGQGGPIVDRVEAPLKT
jgi:hypothetical protein